MTHVSAAGDADEPRAAPDTEPTVDPVDDPPPAVFRDVAVLAGPSAVLVDPEPWTAVPTGDEDQLLFAAHGLPERIEAAPCDAGPDGEPAEAADISGLDEFFATNHLRIARKLAVLFSGDLSHAEDVVQEAFIIAYRLWPLISQKANPYGYVSRIAWNLGLKWLGKQRREREHCARQVGSVDTADIAPEAGLRIDLQRALDLLPDQQQEVMGLSLLGYRNDEISAIMGVPPGTVRTRLHRARKNLERLLDGPGDGTQNGTGRGASA